MPTPGKLYLLPNLLDENGQTEDFLPTSVAKAVSQLEGLIAESEKMARRYLRRFLSHEAMAKMPLKLLNEHSREIHTLIEPMGKGQIWGLISDAGLPCIADPGSDLVWLAHQKNIPVETFVGPSSLFMALQLSGFSGQNFSFHGYLPREQVELEKTLRELEKRKGTQIWIEAPYRSQKMLTLLKQILQPTTKLCVAANLTTPHQKLRSQPLSRWHSDPFALEKEPAVFLIDN
jgi:16S rRNA (cytidine1402-2'-O)-methyltransferase